MADTQQKYSELKKKYALPDFNEINKEFEISAIEHPDFLLKDIRRKIDERLEIFLKILNSILQPETSISEMHECREFGDKDKEEVFRLYKKLIQMHDSALLAGISCEDSEDAAFISSSFREWGSIKKQMTGIVKKMKDAWNTDIDIKEEIGYMG